MNYRDFPRIPAKRFGISVRNMLELALISMTIIFLMAIEPINKALVRDVIKQNATNQQLGRFAHEIIIQSLLCRRFEKDIILNIHDENTRKMYQLQWEEAVERLNQAITGFEITAVGANDLEQVAAWRSSSTEYQEAVLQLLQAIDDGTITQPTEANQLLTSEKGSIRSLTDTATTVAQAKDEIVELSSSRISNTLSTSARFLTLFVVAVCIAWTIITRRA
jgi:hypothetical protein